MAASASGSEKDATSLASTSTTLSAKRSSETATSLASAPVALSRRSCVTCRRRKVACNKQSPCSNCRRANIACVFPSTDRPPRWARRLEHTEKAAASKASAPQDTDPSAGEVMDRLRNLENLVKELSSRHEPADVTQNRDAGPQTATSPVTNTSSVQKQFGRLVLQDASSTRYVSSGFWSRVNDEVNWPVVLTPSS